MKNESGGLAFIEAMKNNRGSKRDRNVLHESEEDVRPCQAANVIFSNSGLLKFIIRIRFNQRIARSDALNGQ